MPQNSDFNGLIGSPPAGGRPDARRLETFDPEGLRRRLARGLVAGAALPAVMAALLAGPLESRADGTPSTPPDSACAPAAEAAGSVPPVLGDGWPVARPAAEGIHPEALAALRAAIDDGRFTKVDSVVIARRGRLVFEAYFNGFTPEKLHDTRSAFKSITSILIGIALDRGLIDEIGSPILPMFPDYERIANWSEDKKAITLEHLLTMTPGFDAEENHGVGPWREDDMWPARDWIKFTLDLPMAYAPGTQFAYNTPTSVLLGGVLRKASGRPVPDFARTALFERLCITEYRWSFSPSGQAMTGGSFFIRPRDLAKFGQLFLDRGVWNGERIVSEAWVVQSTRRRFASLPPGSRKSPASATIGYGYHWWTHKGFLGLPATASYFASGNGGQKIFVFPKRDLVVVFTGSHYNEPIGHRQPMQILKRFILPALQG